MATPNERVITELKKYFSSSEWQQKVSKNPEFAKAMEGLTPNDISFGHQPVFQIGYIEGKSTASAEQTYGNTEQKRTISMSYNTKNYLFTAISNKANKKTLEKAVKTFNYNTDKYYDRTNVETWRKLAEEEGKFLCRRELSDLDFHNNFQHRVTKYVLRGAGDPFTAPIWPINMTYGIDGKSETVEIGYWWERDGKTHIDLDVHVPLTTKQKLITLGVIAAAVVVAIIIIASIF